MLEAIKNPYRNYLNENEKQYYLENKDQYVATSFGNKKLGSVVQNRDEYDKTTKKDAWQAAALGATGWAVAGLTGGPIGMLVGGIAGGLAGYFATIGLREMAAKELDNDTLNKITSTEKYNDNTANIVNKVRNGEDITAEELKNAGLKDEYLGKEEELVKQINEESKLVNKQYKAQAESIEAANRVLEKQNDILNTIKKSSTALSIASGINTLTNNLSDLKSIYQSANDEDGFTLLDFAEAAKIQKYSVK